MAAIHKADRTVTFKIVYCGTPMSGKTTNLHHIHSCLDASTRGDLVSLATSADRTLFFDFMAVEAATVHGYRTRFQLYTVPGQITYNATCQLVLKQADGVVFVADSQMDRQRENMQAFANLETNLRLNGQSLQRMPMVLQYNKRDLPNCAPADYMEYLLNNGSPRCFSYEAAANRGYNVLATLNAVSQLVLQRFAKLMEQRSAGRDEPGEVRAAAPPAAAPRPPDLALA
jgi:mutual gliding-motility protein MglA